ncbi:MAG: hypothetical protein LPK06_03140 [Marinobacter sp.]|nr:hypothetical protein [Marinobacter sp.]
MIDLRAILLTTSVLVGLLPAAGFGLALQAMSDDEMENVSGAGIAVALENFRYMMAPTSYMEQVGVTPAGTEACTGTGSSASNTNCWRRGDLRWYGINLSGDGAGGSYWNEAACNAGSLSCPRGGVIGGAGGWFSPFDNPYLMRAWSPAGMAYNGSLVNTDPNNPDKTIYEYLAPTSQPDYTFSFWGEIEAGATRNPAQQLLSAGTGSANGGALLKSQTIIRGNSAGSVFRLFKFTQPGNETFGMMYTSHLRGDFRFSVAQSGTGATDTIGVPPVFDQNEGLHFLNVDAFLPLGQLYYQALVLGPVGNNGEFYLELTRIPNNPLVFNRFYGLDVGDIRGFQTALTATRDWSAACGGDVACENYRLSHGYVRYGDYYPAMSGPVGWSASGTRESINATNDGIFFRKCDTCPNFNAFAKRPMVIDKRGENSSMQHTQNYNCVSGCTVSTTPITYSSSRYSKTQPPGGPIVQGPGNNGLVYNTSAVSLGSARIEGLLIQQLYIESCQPGVC